MNKERKGDWIQTFTGIAFYPLDPRVEDIDILDIAHALSNMCRFTGHTKVFYSVAEHSCRVAEILPRELKLWGLLHDASEAYLVDLPRPLKRHTSLGSIYRSIEDTLMLTICNKFGLPPQMPKEVSIADDTLLATEARDLLGPRPIPWKNEVIPLCGTIHPWIRPKDIERFFLDIYMLLREQ